MTAMVKQNLEALNKSINVNTFAVKQQLSRAGVPADSAIVFSVAKYYTAVEKLAKE